MGGGGGSAPEAPDPIKVAAAQGAENRRTIQYALNNSRTSTVNPFGTTSWKNTKSFDQAGFDKAMAEYKKSIADYNASQATPAPTTQSEETFQGEGSRSTAPPQSSQRQAPAFVSPNVDDFSGVDNWVNTQTLSPESQGIYDSATGKLKTAVDNISTDANAYNQHAADAIQRRMSRYTDPQNARMRNDLQSNMADRGFQVGNAGYNTEANRLDDRILTSNADIADRAQLGGFAQGQQELNMQHQIANVLSGLRNQQVAGVSGLPNTTTTPSISPVDIAGMMQGQYLAQLDRYNADRASDGNATGQILGLVGAAAGGFSTMSPQGAMAGYAAGNALGGGGQSGTNYSQGGTAGFQNKGQLTGFWGR